MKSETIGYNKFYICLWLIVYIVSVGFALRIFASSIENFNLFENAWPDLILTYSLSTTFLFCFYYVSVFIVLKIRSNNDALVINEKGVWSDVSGFDNKFIPWSAIVKVDLERGQGGGKALSVSTREDKHFIKSEKTLRLERQGILSPETVIFYQLLNRKPADIVDLINEGLEQYNETIQGSDMVEHSLESYVQRAA